MGIVFDCYGIGKRQLGIGKRRSGIGKKGLARKQNCFDSNGNVLTGMV
jgi:hypothetical protein